MSDYRPHGVQPEQVVNSRFYLRDTRHPTQRFREACRKPGHLGMACFVTAGVIYAYPTLVDAGLLLGLMIALRAATLRPELPLKLPDYYQGIDPHDPLPGDRGRLRRARGVFFLGNARKSLAQLWTALADVLTHLLVIGGTGAGKTEAMLSMAANSLLWGSGFTYTDGKGDSALWTKAFALLRACGREDDLYVINYMTASRTIDPDAPVADRLTNQFNPYVAGSADAMVQLTSSLLSEVSGDSASWRDKALGLLTAIAPLAYEMRERGLDEHGQPFVLDVGSLQRLFTLDTLIDLYLRTKHRVEGFTLSAGAFSALRAYLESVPGYQDPERLWKQNAQTASRPFDDQVIIDKDYPTQPEPQAYVQHGYLQSQYQRVFSQLAHVYGHIYRCHYGEVDFQDVVVNRRALIVMLPALEKSPVELAGLGKIIIAAKKTMLAVGLGSRLEGTHREVIDNKPIHSESPFLDINDEYGYYAVKGFAVVPAQARSLGFSVIFGGQDTPSFGKESKEEAQAVFGNTLIKIAMRIEDAGESFELFQKTAGEALVTQTSGFSRHDNAWLSNYYHDNHAASVERRNRIDLRDIRDQTEGQAHVFVGSQIIRANLFHADIPSAKAYRINRFLQVLPLTDEQVHDTQQALTPEAIHEGVQRILATRNPLLELMRAAHDPVIDGLRRERGNAGFARGVVEYLSALYQQCDRDTADAISALADGGVAIEAGGEGGAGPPAQPDTAAGDTARNATPGPVRSEPVERMPALDEDDLLLTGLCAERDAGLDEALSAPADPPDTVIDAEHAIRLAEASSAPVPRQVVPERAEPFPPGAALDRMAHGRMAAAAASLLWPLTDRDDERPTVESLAPESAPAQDHSAACEKSWHDDAESRDTDAEQTRRPVRQTATPGTRRPTRTPESTHREFSESFLSGENDP